jgi:hypothetical protein
VIHRFPLHPLAVALAAASLLLTPNARAASNDAKAEELREKAIFDDYLNLRFQDAEAKLNEAIQLCESGCSNPVKAKLYRDLGVVYIAGLKQREAGVGMFVEAVTHDKGIQLDPDLSSDELQAALAEARELAGDATPPEPSAPSEPESSGGANQPPPKSDKLLPVDEFEGVFHTPVEEQLVNTPIPIYVEVHDENWTAKVKAVRLNYRGFGMVRFKEVDLPKVGEHGYGFEVDCKEVGMSQGKFDYYVVVVDEDGDAAADIGTERSPHSVQLKSEIEYSPQPLPGREIPPQCEMPAAGAAPEMASGEPSSSEDCPPDFPGCGGSEFEEEWDSEPELPDHAQFSRHWIVAGGQLDFLWMHEAPDACSGNFTSELSCFEGETYWDPRVEGRTNDFQGDGVIDGAGSTSGGFALATKRILIGYDYAITQNFLLGARLGFAMGGAPRLVDADPNTPDTNPEFLALHAELRGAYWFGDTVLSEQLVRPFVQVSGGAAQVDAGLETEVIDLSDGRSCVERPDPATGQPAVTCRVPVTAWRKTGTFFVSAGGGVVFAFAKSAGVLLEGRLMQMLPASGTALGAGAGVVVGF